MRGRRVSAASRSRSASGAKRRAVVPSRQGGPARRVFRASGYAEDAFEKSLPEKEQFAFLPKPFTLTQLVAAVKETMTPQ